MQRFLAWRWALAAFALIGATAPLCAWAGSADRAARRASIGAQRPAAKGAAPTELVVKVGKSTYKFPIQTRFHNPVEQASFIKSKFESCLSVTNNKDYCKCFVSFYMEPSNGMDMDTLIDYENAVTRSSMGRDGRPNRALTQKTIEDPRYFPYLEYGLRARQTCDARFQKQAARPGAPGSRAGAVPRGLPQAPASAPARRSAPASAPAPAPAWGAAPGRAPNAPAWPNAPAPMGR